MGPKVDVASALLLHQESADAHFIIQTLKRFVSVPPPVMKGLGVVGNQEMGQKEALALQFLMALGTRAHMLTAGAHTRALDTNGGLSASAPSPAWDTGQLWLCL